MAINIVIPASCATLSSASNVTMFTNMLVVAMVSASGLPVSYITVVGVVNNTCVQQSRRRRSLLLQRQQLSYDGSGSSSQSTPTTVAAVSGDGSATVKMTVTWPLAGLVAPGTADDRTTSSVLPQAELIVANYTSHAALSSFFTPSFMAAYEIRATPYALSIYPMMTSPSNTARYNSTSNTAAATDNNNTAALPVIKKGAYLLYRYILQAMCKCIPLLKTKQYDFKVKSLMSSSEANAVTTVGGRSPLPSNSSQPSPAAAGSPGLTSAPSPAAAGSPTPTSSICRGNGGGIIQDVHVDP